MELLIAGGCLEHGRNCFYVRGREVSFLVDAGIMKENPDTPYPELTKDQIQDAAYLFLTHCHSDHTGAVKWLYDQGFHGEVIASAPTFAWMKDAVPGRTLESMSVPGKKCKVDDHLKMTWGRSGHCIGSVWYLFRLDGRKILFTGDYQEHSGAYKCDRIRDLAADLALVDTAYGTESGTAGDYRKDFEGSMDRLVKTNRPYLFPVPSHGRGLDVLRALSEREIPIYMEDSIISECLETPDREFWLRKKFRGSFGNSEVHTMEELGQLMEETGGLSFLELPIGILVQDSQLVRQENRDLTAAVIKAGGRVVLTGKQDPASFSRDLLSRGDAVFWKISVHQNADEALRLKHKNRFRFMIPCHCRKKLDFKERDILTVRTGNLVKF